MLKDDEYDLNLRTLCWVNRQPSLHSHSAPVCNIEPAEDELRALRLNPLIIEQMNADFDGDNIAIYLNHDISSLQEMYERAFYRNIISYDANESVIALIRHEALYSAYILSSYLHDDNYNVENEDVLFTIDNLQDLEENIDYFNNNLHSAVVLNNKKYPYGICLLNKWMGSQKDIYINKEVTKKVTSEISHTIYEKIYNNDSKKYYDQLADLERKLMFFITITNHTPSINITEMMNMVNDDNQRLFSLLPDNNVYLAYYLNEGLVNRCIENFDQNTKLYKLYRSGSRFNKQQLSRSCINIGLVADDCNIIEQRPVKTSLIEGLTLGEFFRSASGSRKGENLPF